MRNQHGCLQESEVPLLLMKNFVVPGARTERLAGKTELSFERMTEFLTVYSTAMKQIKQQGLKKKKVESCQNLVEFLPV